MNILLVEDNPGDAHLLQQQLKDAFLDAYMLVLAGTLGEAVAELARGQFDVMLLDLSLPDTSGLDTVVMADAAAPDLAIVVLTGLDDENTAVDAVRRGAQDYLIKGQMGATLLIRSLKYAVERKRLNQELKEAVATVKRLTGLLPICASCKKIRDDSGYWTQVEEYIEERSEASFTHGLCPECVHRMFPEYAEEDFSEPGR